MGNRKYLKNLMRVAAALVIVGGAGMMLAPEAKADGREWKQVRVLGYQTGPEGVMFQVPTGGCLRKADFVVQRVEDQDFEGLHRVILITNKADRCREFFPYGTTVKFTFDELGVNLGEGFIIENAGGIVRRAGFAEIFQPVEQPAAE